MWFTATILLLVQIFLSPHGISPKSRRTWLLGSKALLSCLTPGVQGEGEVGTNREGEVEDLTLVCQCLAEVHALGGKGGVIFTHRTHFGSTSE